MARHRRNQNTDTRNLGDINISIGLYHEEKTVAEPLRVTVEDNTLIVKFDATAVADYVWRVVYHMGIVPPIPPQANYTMKFTVSGKLLNDEQIEEQIAGSDTIKVISP